MKVTSPSNNRNSSDVSKCTIFFISLTTTGFATHVEKVGLHHMHEEFKSDHLIVDDDRVRAMVRDAQEGSLPVHYDGNNLGPIVYSKASLLIRMMEAFMGEIYLRGINDYLEAQYVSPT